MISTSEAGSFSFGCGQEAGRKGRKFLVRLPNESEKGGGFPLPDPPPFPHTSLGRISFSFPAVLVRAGNELPASTS